MGRSRRRSRHLPHVPLRAAGFARLETGPDGEWLVRSVSGSSSGKRYRCPGCEQPLPAGTPHLVGLAGGGLRIGRGPAALARGLLVGPAPATPWRTAMRSAAVRRRRPRVRRRLADLERFFSRGGAHRLVMISWRDWRVHRRRRACRSPGCPG